MGPLPGYILFFSIALNNAATYLWYMSDAVFVREYVKTGDAMLAFNRAGFVTGGVGVKVASERVLARPEIKLALAVLAELGIERTEDLPVDKLSRDGLVDKLEVIHDMALADEAFPSAINAVKTQAQLLGYMDQVVTVNHNMSARELTLEDLRALVAKEVGGHEPAMIEAEYKEIDNDVR